MKILNQITNLKYFLTQPRYQKKIACAIFPGSEKYGKCWNYGNRGIQWQNTDTPLTPANIAAWKAQFYDSKRNVKEKNSKLVLNEIVTELIILFEVKTKSMNSPAATYFELTTYLFSDDSETTSDSAIEEKEERVIQFMENNLHKCNYDDEGYDTDF